MLVMSKPRRPITECHGWAVTTPEGRIVPETFELSEGAVKAHYGKFWAGWAALGYTVRPVLMEVLGDDGGP